LRLRHLQWASLAFVMAGSLGVAASLRQDRLIPDRAGPRLEEFQSGEVDVRRSAANRLRLADRNSQRQALPTLIDLLSKEKDGQVRLAVLDTLTALGPDAELAIPALVLTFQTSYGASRTEKSHQDYRAALALGGIGKPAVEGLRGLLKVPRENVRAEAIMGLGRIGADAGPSVADLVLLLGDKSERISREAALALGRIGPSTVEPLIAACSDRDSKVRALAIEALGGLSAANDQVFPVVLRAAREADSQVRAEAVRSLGRLRYPEADLMPTLREGLRDKGETVRRAVVDLLDARRSFLPELAPDLETLLLADDDGVSRLAAVLLGKMGRDGVPRLLDALPHKESRIDQIAEALAQVGRPALGPLNRAIEASEPRLRRGAALALGRIRPPAPGVVPKLLVGLNDPDQGVKTDFLAAIGQIGPRASEAVPVVRAMLGDESATIRLQVIAILAHSAPRDDLLVGDLSGLLRDGDPRVRGRAIDLLQSLGPLARRALTPVIGLLKSPDSEVRRSAVEFIESHGSAGVEAVPALSDLLADPVPKIRMTTARTLGKLGRPAQSAFAPIASLLDDKQPEVREVAALTLGNLELDADTLRPSLSKALRDEKTEVRRAAMKSIQRLGPQGAILVPDIIALAANKENQRSVDRLLRPFERTGPDVRSVPDLIKQLDHEQVGVRLLAIKFLGLAGQEASGAIPALERFREDPSADVRQQAKTACEQIKNDGPSRHEKDRLGSTSPNP